MKFSEMRYERPDVEAIKAGMTDLIKRLQEADSYETAKAVFLEADKFTEEFSTMGTLAHVRHTIDTRDQFYDDEMKFWNVTMPELQQYSQQWTMTLLQSPFRKDFSEEYGDLMFLNAEIALKSFSPSRFAPAT